MFVKYTGPLVSIVKFNILEAVSVICTPEPIFIYPEPVDCNFKVTSEPEVLEIITPFEIVIEPETLFVTLVPPFKVVT